MEQITKQINELKKIEYENEWANVFHDTIIDSAWLKNKCFSPGRWAVGYPYLYVLYRCLNEVKPASILELGLGQSTRMITQYADYYKNIKHYVTEHDDEWIEFFKKTFSLSDNTSLQKLELCDEPFADCEKVLSYKGFEEAFGNKKFDLISIDAPFGGNYNGESYARADVCRLLPDILNESFIIIMDDVNRKEDKKTALEMEKILIEHDISCFSKIYYGRKQVFVIVSSDLRFFTTL